MPTAIRNEVESRYARAAQAPEAALCCPVDYDRHYLEVIPEEVIAKDYGCGDPSRWLQPGETVLDLGSGTGKIAFIAAQVVGPEGRVIGVDMTDAMLEVARRHAPAVARAIGYANVEFRKGRIQDLRLDLELLDASLREAPVSDAASYLALADRAEALRTMHPLVADDSVDVVVSNCVLNLVEPEDKPRLFREIHRVLRRGGRAVISDIVSDEPVPSHLRADPELWSGCISGALTERDFLRAFEEAGFYGIECVKFEAEPWRTVEGIEFRSITVRAFKGNEGPCLDHRQAVLYKGPFRAVEDDDGHRYPRGLRMAVCDKTYRLLQRSPYASAFAFFEPAEPVAETEAPPFACDRGAVRDPRETKGRGYRATTPAAACTGSDCC
ncbi:MAG: methyltransferase domain-containing protein [Puniceicoccaceae bacterium]|nr:MAG: methyltransferase domain-containing protein [Puniceicoccaceae bacterium]